MIIKQMVLGPIQANCFILGCEKTKKSVVIDPGSEPESVLMSLAQDKLTLECIINTHGHFDHIGGNRKLKEVTGAKIMIHSKDEDMLLQSASDALVWGLKGDKSPKPDKVLEDGDTIIFGNYELKVIYTPGHTLGGISLYNEYVDERGLLVKSVFVGDTLFAGSVGRTDLPGGNLKTLISSIHNKLFFLGDDVTVYPGHMQTTTIGNEKISNPFCGLNL